MSETNDSMPDKFDITQIFLRILRIIIYILGVTCIMFYYFDVISLIIGALYFSVFKDDWRKHGFLLALAAAISALLPQRGVADITGIYPLYLVLLVGWGMIFVYFLLYILYKIIKKYDLLKEWRSNFHQRLNFQRFPQKYTPFVLIVLILIPIGIWVNVNVNLAVILDNNPKLLWINAPSTVNESTQFDFIVEA
ncbi:MAG: hypothetical protein ACFFDT_14390 [Candidatus Hodarchaeota archaeon]